MQDFSWLSRTALLVGDDRLKIISEKHVLVVGLGGVGSYAAEFIARAGVGTLTIVDGDVVDPTNRNRQLPALTSTHGLSKADLMAQRLRDINPEIILHVRKDFLTPDKAEEICRAAPYDYVVDCIDSLTPKLYLITTAISEGLNIVSSMGAGGKMDPMRIKISDLSDTYNDHFALQIRKRLKSKGIRNNLICVFSDEPSPKSALIMTDGTNFKKSAYGTISYLPAAFGGVCASVVIRHLLGEQIVFHKNLALNAVRKREAKKVKKKGSEKLEV